jgi:hypothetical protein
VLYIRLRATEILQIFVGLSRIFLLTLASRFMKIMQHKKFFFDKLILWLVMMKMMVAMTMIPTTTMMMINDDR